MLWRVAGPWGAFALGPGVRVQWSHVKTGQSVFTQHMGRRCGRRSLAQPGTGEGHWWLIHGGWWSDAHRGARRLPMLWGARWVSSEKLDFLPALRGRGFLLSSDPSLYLSIQVGSRFTARWGQAPPTLGSTGVHPLRQSGSEDVTGSIPVTVVLCPAGGAPPPTDGQVFLPVTVPTLRAGPGGGLPAGNNLKRPSVHPGFGLQESPQQTPVGVCYRAGQFAVLHHPRGDLHPVTGDGQGCQAQVNAHGVAVGR